MRCCEHNFRFNYPNDTLNKLSEERSVCGVKNVVRVQRELKQNLRLTLGFVFFVFEGEGL